MRARHSIAAACAATLLLSSPTYAQGVQPGDRIFVTDRNGVQSEGRLLHLSPTGLAFLVDGNERLIPAKRIGRIERRDSLWNGMVIGAAPFAMIWGLGAGASCSPRCGHDLPIAMLVGGAMGAGVGALVDMGVRGYSIVDGPPLASPNAAPSARVIVPEELWRSVRQGDTIGVVTLRGEKITGKFIEASSMNVALMVDGRRREIPSTDVRRVSRAGNRYRSGALWGGAVLGTVGFLSSVSCTGGCANPGIAALFSGSGGALLGTVIGGAIPRHLVVYEAGTSPIVRLAPMLGRDRIGMAFSMTF